MATFNDKNGLTWDIVIDSVTIDDVRSETRVSLYEMCDDPELKEFRELCSSKNRALFTNVVYVLVKEQCQARNISDRDFARAINGDAMESMAEAFYRALVDYGASGKKKLMMLELMTESKTLLGEFFTKGKDKAMKKLQSTFGSLLASLDSIPEGSDSAT